MCAVCCFCKAREDCCATYSIIHRTMHLMHTQTFKASTPTPVMLQMRLDTEDKMEVVWSYAGICGVSADRNRMK